MKFPKYLIKQANDLRVEHRYGHWCIVRISDGVCMLSQIPSKEEAERIIKEAQEYGKK